MLFDRVSRVAFVAIAGMLIFGSVPASAQDQAAPAVDQAAIDRFEEKKSEIRKLEAMNDEKAEDANHFFTLANLYADLSRNMDAANAYKTSLEIDPDYVEALVNYGSLQNQVGELKSAVEVLSHAVELAPNEPKATINLGNAYYNQGEYFLAMEQYRAAKAADSESFEADYQIGVAFADAGIYREAVNSWARVVEGVPETDAAKAAAQNIEVVEKILARRQ